MVGVHGRRVFVGGEIFVNGEMFMDQEGLWTANDYER